MCGSGTLIIEAAMVAANIAPGLLRPKFGFETWRNFDAQLWKRLKEEATEKIDNEVDVAIYGSDISEKALQATCANAEAAGVDDMLRISCKDFRERQAPKNTGILLTNPPYGMRITDSDLFALYKSIGDTLKRNYTNYTAWILSANRDAMKYVGLKPSLKLDLFNGGLECTFRKYELFDGKLQDVEK
jgi:putative N6-adenine-specific DNA methylase